MAKREMLRHLPKPSTPSAATTLAEAVGIVTRAHDDLLEIDWTGNPKTEREAALRLAMIRAIERENAELLR